MKFFAQKVHRDSFNIRSTVSAKVNHISNEFWHYNSEDLRKIAESERQDHHDELRSEKCFFH